MSMIQETRSRISLATSGTGQVRLGTKPLGGPIRRDQGRTSTTVTALIYTRVSSDDQAREGVSLDAQLADCRKYAARNGWSLGTEYQDILSGRRDDRPAYQRLLSDIRTLCAQGTSVVVVVAALDRFGRRLLERVRSREELKDLGVAVHSVREGGEVSDLVANMLGAVAQEEVRWLGERVRVSRAYIRERGFKAPGHTAWGYRLRPATPEERAEGAPRSVLDIDEEAAPYLGELFQRIADGSSLHQATRWVQTIPEPMRRGKQLALSAVASLVRSPTYIARPGDATGDVLAYPKMKWPPLIDDTLWLRVQERIAEHAVHPHQASGQYLLTGFLRCPLCGGRVAGRRNVERAGRRHRYYNCIMGLRYADQRCNWSGSTRAIDEPVLDLVSRVLAPFASTDRAFLAALDRAWRGLHQPDEDKTRGAHRVTGLQRTAERARKRIAAAATMFVDGDIDRAGYEMVRDRAHAELFAIEEELTRLEEREDRVELPSLPEVLNQVGTWGALLKEADVALQREVLAVLVHRVEAEKVGFGQYGVRVIWTPLGQALAEVADPEVSGPNGLHVGPLLQRPATPRVCVTCGRAYLGKDPSRYCQVACRPPDKRGQRARLHQARGEDKRAELDGGVV